MEIIVIIVGMEGSDFVNETGQNALSYLMTYGWALVVIIIVLAALFAFGIFNEQEQESETIIEEPIENNFLSGAEWFKSFECWCDTFCQDIGYSWCVPKGSSWRGESNFDLPMVHFFGNVLEQKFECRYKRGEKKLVCETLGEVELCNEIIPEPSSTKRFDFVRIKVKDYCGS